MNVAAAVGAGPRVLDPATVSRTEVVRPSMCGHNSLFIGQIGDWTWDAVSLLCGTDVLRARDAAGAPTYLSFYYYRVRGSQGFHLRSPTFGDRLRVTSRLFDFGSESVLALHHITRSPDGNRDAPLDSPFHADTFYAPVCEDCLYVENFNRWITRGGRTNDSLVRSSPADFRHRHLPALPEAYSPRYAAQRARTRLTFLDTEDGRHRADGEALCVAYEIDPARDLNAVGLVYFAAYFSIVDWALLQLWRRLGRSDRSFLDRVVVDQQVCCFGNTDAGCPVVASLQRWRIVDDDTREVIDVVLRDQHAGRVLVVCTLHLLVGASA